MFNEMVVSKLENYVYALSDPTDERGFPYNIFYIGKGVGDRCFSHACRKVDWSRQKDSGDLKLEVIGDIITSGNEVVVTIISHGIKDESEAFRIESILIPLLGDSNKVAGHGDSKLWLAANEIIELYDDPIQRTDFSELKQEILFVSLNQRNISKIKQNDEAAAEATLGDWIVGLGRAKRVKYILGVKGNLVQTVFQTTRDDEGITKFETYMPEKKGSHRRHRFEGKQLHELEEKLQNRSIHFNGLHCTKMPSGGAYRYFDKI